MGIVLAANISLDLENTLNMGKSCPFDTRTSDERESIRAQATTFCEMKVQHQSLSP